MSQLVNSTTLNSPNYKRLRLNIPALMTVAVLYTVIFGAHPFATRVATTDLTANTTPAYYWGIYILTNLLVATVFLKSFSRKSLRLFSALFYLLYAWALISLIWSTQPALGLSRYIQLMIVTISALTIVQSLGPVRTLDILAKFLFFTIVVDWISIAVIPQAIHIYDENDTNLIGSWRGLHIHKNIAAPLMVIACLLFLSRLTAKRSVFNLLGLLFAAGFLLGTNSRTSIGFFAVTACVFIALHFRKNHSPFSGLISATVFSMLVIIGIILFHAHYETIKVYLSDPLIFSGRGGLWGIIMILSSNYDFIGFGYGSFWRVGFEGISYEYASGWHASSFNGHNGYLDILVTLGWVGFWLGIATFVFEPVIFCLTRANRWNQQTKTAFTIIIFIILHNLLESTVLMWNADTYFIWLLAACILHYPIKKGITH